jgi:predicted metal-dependent phosphoesterase TrpH
MPEVPSIWNVMTPDVAAARYAGLPRMDTHCHTYYSDGCWDLPALVAKARRCGFPAVTKTDHNRVRGNDRLARLARRAGLVFIPGVEISTDRGHLVALNLDEWPGHMRRLEEVLEYVHEHNGVAVLAHPWWQTLVQPSPQEGVFALPNLDGYEALNGSCPLGNLKYMKAVYPRGVLDHLNTYRYRGWAGSDSHGGRLFGLYYTIFHTTDVSRAGIVEAMLKGHVSAVGPFYPLWDFLVDGALNQPVQLKKQWFYKKG